MDAIPAILYLRSRETLQLQHAVHVNVEKTDAFELSRVRSHDRNKNDGIAYSKAAFLSDIRFVMPFLELAFQHSDSKDVKIFTMKPRRVMAIHQLYINLLPQYGRISDTIRIILLLLDNYSTQMLETIVGGKTIKTMQIQYIRKLGIQCFSQPSPLALASCQHSPIFEGERGG